MNVTEFRRTARTQRPSVYRDEPQKRLTSLAQWFKAPPLHLYPEKPPNPRLKSPQNKPKILCSNFLDTQLPCQYTHNTQKRVLIKYQKINLWSFEDENIAQKITSSTVCFLFADSPLLARNGFRSVCQGRRWKVFRKLGLQQKLFPALYASESTSGAPSASSTPCASRRSRPELSLWDGRWHHGGDFGRYALP
jgi:hypothetical protein